MTYVLADLIKRATVASRTAYVPYSQFSVGAALLAANGQLYTGCNVENASYPVTICAERTALVKAVSEGVREFEIIVIATENGGSPCGVCRQMLVEFSPEMRVVCVTFAGQITIDSTLSAVLPHHFGPKQMGLG